MAEAKYKIGDLVWVVKRKRPWQVKIIGFLVHDYLDPVYTLQPNRSKYSYDSFKRQEDLCFPTLEALLDHLKQTAIPYKQGEQS